jgi:hypothetical protein
MSERYNPVPSPVDIYFRPYTDIEPGGRLMVQAPSGFRIEHECFASLEAVVDPGETPIDKPNVICEGDINPSNNGYVMLPAAKAVAGRIDPAELAANAGNKLMNGQLYKLTIDVANPQSVSAARDWVVMSYKTVELSDLADKSYIQGYSVSYRVVSFSFNNPPATISGTMRVSLVFTFAFPQRVVADDRIVIDAPFGFVQNEDGRNDCMQYRHRTGFLKRTQPTCGANRMTWLLTDEMLPQDSPVTVTFETINPARTPAMNFFAIKHLKPNDSVYASRLISGYVILPQLKDVNVYLAPPPPPSPPPPALKLPSPSEAVGSISTVVIKFVPESSATHVGVVGRVDDINYFDMTDVHVPSSITTVSQDAQRWAGKMVCVEYVLTQVTLYHVTNPMVAGMSIWDITTFVGGTDFSNRMDQKLGVEGFPVLGRLTVKISSTVRPNFYGGRRATANFNFFSSVPLVAGDTLYITRPLSFELYDKTLVVKRFLTVLPGGHGLDPLDPTGRRYMIVLDGPTAPDTEVGISIEVALPPAPVDVEEGDIENLPNWLFYCYDKDGNPKASNDYLFPGFLLVGQIPFFVEPQMKTPGALGYMKVSFTLPQSVVGIEKVEIVLTAPTGFQFSASCLGGLSLAFTKCSGSSNLATLESVTNRVNAGDHEVVLLGSNAPETPAFNMWKLAAYLDDSKTSQYINFSQWPGFNLIAMAVSVKGNNQLASDGSLFFTITPAKTAERKAQILIVPPRKQGYSLNCQGAFKVGLPKEPECSTTGAKGAELVLTISNATIVSGIEYTFSVGVLNPGSDVPKDSNQWSVSLKDRFGAVVDSNRNVQGLTLKLFPARVMSLAWSEVLPTSIARVRIEINFNTDIEPGGLSEVQIASPDGVMFSDPSTAFVSPDKFPLIDQSPFTAAGNIMRVLVDTSMLLEKSMYGFNFDVKNPSKRLPNDNTWGTALIYNGDLLLSHVQPGYQWGEPSPYVIGMPQAPSLAYLASILFLLWQ